MVLVSFLAKLMTVSFRLRVWPAGKTLAKGLPASALPGKNGPGRSWRKSVALSVRPVAVSGPPGWSSSSS